MKRFETERVAGWCHASDAETASLIDRVIEDLELRALKCERATSNLERLAVKAEQNTANLERLKNLYWDISDRH